MDEHTLNYLLECSVCLERLDTSSKVLPCQHTFCRKCLEVIYASRQELRCPECRVLVDTKIEDLPPNVLLMRILEGMKNASAASKQQQQQQAFSNKDLQTQKDQETEDLKDINRPTTSKTSKSISPSNDERLRQQQLKQRQQQVLHLQQQQQQQKQHQQQQQNAQQSQRSARQQQQQQYRCIVPHAYALYDFDSNETTDLKFKKGDLILLRRRIDSNWYVGQAKGAEGTFPINYVQIVVPLPTPQCIALYDFRMGPNEEEGCLTFKKGTVINVLRRVDQNWAEGRIAASIGIFPIAFVELNHLAKQLLDSAATSAPSQPSTTTAQPAIKPKETSRNLPPIPSVLDPTTNSTNSDSTTTSPSSPSSSSSSSAAAVSNTNQTAIIYSSNSSGTTPSPISTAPANIQLAANTSSASSSSSSNSTSFHSMPNSPQNSMPTTPQHIAALNATGAGGSSGSSSVRMRNSNDLKHKRHSLNALLSSGSSATGNSLSILQSNRHSAEILSVPNDLKENEAASTSTSGLSATPQFSMAREQQMHTSNLPMPSSAATLSDQQTAPTLQHPVGQQQQQQQQPGRHNVLKTCVQQNTPPTLPWGYLALYPYKPRKNDELELKKGCVYMVIERCLDGWFKGKNWKDVCGVFPGNYVAPLRPRDHQQLMHSWKLIPPPMGPAATAQNHATPLSVTTTTTGQPNITQQQQFSPNYSTSMRNDLENINARLTLAQLTPHQAMPPDLPPRQQTVTANSNNSNTNNNNTVITQSSIAISAKESRDREAQKEKPTTMGCISSSGSSSSSTTTTNTTSSASTGLKKFLTHIKSRSKSPGGAAVTAAAQAANLAVQPLNNQFMQPPQQKCQNSLKQTQNTFNNTLNPVHVRSGSCPSQLLQNLPIEFGSLTENNASAAGSVSQQHRLTSQQQQQQQQQQFSPQIKFGGGSQRVKGNKERPTIQSSRPSIDSTLRSIYANQIQQQSSLIPNKCGQQLPQQQQQQQQQQQHYHSINNVNTNNSAVTTASASSTTILHRKSHSLDASNILQSSATPLNNTINTSLTGSHCGGSAAAGAAIMNSTLPQCNINAAIHASATTKSPQNSISESRFRCVVPYPPNSDVELELQIGDVIFVYRKQKNGWYKGTNSRTNKTGLFPASFVEPDF